DRPRGRGPRSEGQAVAGAVPASPRPHPVQSVAGRDLLRRGRADVAGTGPPDRPGGGRVPSLGGSLGGTCPPVPCRVTAAAGHSKVSAADRRSAGGTARRTTGRSRPAAASGATSAAVHVGT